MAATEQRAGKAQAGRMLAACRRAGKEAPQAATPSVGFDVAHVQWLIPSESPTRTSWKVQVHRV